GDRHPLPAVDRAGDVIRICRGGHRLGVPVTGLLILVVEDEAGGRLLLHAGGREHRVPAPVGPDPVGAIQRELGEGHRAEPAALADSLQTGEVPEVRLELELLVRHRRERPVHDAPADRALDLADGRVQGVGRSREGVLRLLHRGVDELLHAIHRGVEAVIHPLGDVAGGLHHLLGDLAGAVEHLLHRLGRIKLGRHLREFTHQSHPAILPHPAAEEEPDSFRGGIGGLRPGWCGQRHHRGIRSAAREALRSRGSDPYSSGLKSPGPTWARHSANTWAGSCFWPSTKVCSMASRPATVRTAPAIRARCPRGTIPRRSAITSAKAISASATTCNHTARMASSPSRSGTKASQRLSWLALKVSAWTSTNASKRFAVGGAARTAATMRLKPRDRKSVV